MGEGGLFKRLGPIAVLLKTDWFLGDVQKVCHDAEKGWVGQKCVKVDLYSFKAFSQGLIN